MLPHQRIYSLSRQSFPITELNKIMKTKYTNIRIKPEVHKKLRKLAKVRGWTLSYLIASLVIGDPFKNH